MLYLISYAYLLIYALFICGFTQLFNDKSSFRKCSPEEENIKIVKSTKLMVFISMIEMQLSPWDEENVSIILHPDMFDFLIKLLHQK